MHTDGRFMPYVFAIYDVNKSEKDEVKFIKGDSSLQYVLTGIRCNLLIGWLRITYETTVSLIEKVSGWV